MLIKHTRNTAGRGDGTDRASNVTHNVHALTKDSRTRLHRHRRRRFRAKEEQIAHFLILRVMKSLCQTNKDEPERSEEQ